MPSRPRHSTSIIPAFSRRGLLAAAIAGPPLAAFALFAPPVHADPAVTGGDTRIVDVPLRDVLTRQVDGATVREIAQQRCTMAGVTWDDPAQVLDVAVRARDDNGTWSDWYRLEQMCDPSTGEPVGGTELAWLGAVDAVQVRVEQRGADFTAAATAHLVTTSPAPDDAAPTRTAAGEHAPANEPGTTTSTVTGAGGVGGTGGPIGFLPMGAPNPATPALGPGAPTFISRAAWGANESITRSTSGAKELKGIVIHHTEGSNDYTASTSAQILRGIQSYHASTLGWADVGYNLLIDKFGQIFEGRSGGLHRNIVGAHAYGFNTGTFGISVMGSYMAAAPSQAARDAVARVIGWKLRSAFIAKATDSVSWTPGDGTRLPAGVPVSLPRVFGHRDVNYTDCPGSAFYAQLGSVRTAAQMRLDASWRVHYDAFTKAGGASALGTVVRSAHSNGRFWATELTKGLVLSEGS